MPDKQLRDWFKGFLGRRYAAVERVLIERALEKGHGYQILQLGHVLDVEPKEQFERVIRLHWQAQADTDVVTSPGALPLSSDSVDALVAPHLLELHAQPHEILRELHRVLRPEGLIVLSGFSPVSAIGALRAVRRRKESAPWSCNWLTATRISDWLSLLGFELVKVRTQRLPVSGASSKRVFSMASVVEASRPALRTAAGVYTFAARKKVMWVRPVVSRWRERRVVPVGGFAEPSLRLVVNRNEET